MTLIFDQTTPLTDLSPASLYRAASAHRLLLLALGFQIALAVPSLIALGIDDRLLNGISVWIKPLKFQLSLAVMMATLLWLLPLIDERALASRGLWLAAFTAAMTAMGEIAYITLQAARGRASHFNDSTPIEATMYSIMGIAAALLVLSALVIGVYILTRPSPLAPAGLRLGGGWGLILGAILTLITAFALGSGQIGGPGHWVGGIRTDVGGLPLFGWSRTGGDLRVPHFFATHIMQALPILGFVLDRFLPGQARLGIAAGAVASIAVVAATFVQAVRAVPFL
ncbi:hypothetical protein ASE36_01235 [Rhizobium sp. Root274]|uniref:hypothetical protein n=1 Tax=unclassified Rhizobium TaxID=2613769 RepID=UPI0007138912|nr:MULTISPECIES: hypothetical protein [unclassified Rhizobium]KQW30949.1 hypothetical protein ASC71_01240 [Rhizobium sp. Root1240]KRD32494.1 hypothetical protein ASE36_01235 [Rhizobium sp. Root274]